MKSKLYEMILGLGLAVGSVAIAQARIALLSPGSFQERRATPLRQVDQTAGILSGINGVSPSGGDGDVKFVVFPYSLTYGILEKLEMGAGWGLQWLDRKGRSSQFGIQDLTVAARYRFFDPNRAERVPGLDMEAGFSFPTASFEKGLGTGGLGILFNWGLVLPLDPLRAHFQMGYRLNTENSDDVTVGSVFSYGGGVSVPLQRGREDLLLTGEIKGFNHARNKVSGTKIGSEADELYLAPGALWRFHPKAQLSGSLLIGLTTDSSDIGFVAEVRF